MRDLKVWVRVGDEDDYSDFDSIDEATAHVHEYLHWPGFEDDGPCQGTHAVERYQGAGLRGIVLPGTPYQGNNGVSFFWGDDDAQFEADISNLELDAVRNILAVS